MVMEHPQPGPESRAAITVSLDQLKNDAVPFEVLEEAFGPLSLGILIVIGLPARFAEIRHQLLSYSSYLANLPSEELGVWSISSSSVRHSVVLRKSPYSPLFISYSCTKDHLTIPSAAYLTGWSHGKEALKTGSYDTLKGSYYVNCAFYQDPTLQSASGDTYKDFPEYTAPNVWPPERLLPGFRTMFEELCTLIIDTGVLVAKACDRYALANIEGYEKGYLERVVRTSTTTKARLLHYFPPEFPNDTENETGEKNENDDSWCATHIDHGCLTGLTSALYIDEAANPPVPPVLDHRASALAPLPALSSAPSPEAGLYIKSRTSAVTKVNIPSLSLGFQTGEALQLITGGKFRAVPHFVRAGSRNMMADVARNNLAVFMQPNLDEVVDREKGLTFAEFATEVNGRFG